jgi:hypothetical protein
VSELRPSVEHNWLLYNMIHGLAGAGTGAVIAADAELMRSAVQSDVWVGYGIR